MKVKLLLVALFSALLFTACQPEKEPNCRDNVLGTYEGEDIAGNKQTVEIQAGVGEKSAILTFKMSNGSGSDISFPMIGELEENCSVLTILKQNIGAVEIGGTFTLTDDNLKGTLIKGGSFTIDMTKK